MNTNKTISAALSALLAVAAPAAAQTAQPQQHPAAMQAGNFGEWTIRSDQFHGQGDTFVYDHAHMTAQNGSKLDADQVRIDLASSSGANGNGLQNIVATGHVHAFFVQVTPADASGKPVPPRTITVTSDKAVYDPATQEIHLTGNVQTSLASRFTSGPFVQTGDTGLIKLGATLDDTQITMNNVHATFTPQQQPVTTAAPVNAAPSSSSGSR